MSDSCKDIYAKFHACLFSNTFEGSHPYPNDVCRDLEKKFLKCEVKYKNEKKTLYNDTLFNEYLNTMQELPVYYKYK